jgi:MFS family permease
MASGVSREQWRKTALAAMANYIDAGSIVAGADVPASWTLITETAPAKARGRLAGMLIVSGPVGIAFAPRDKGRELDDDTVFGGSRFKQPRQHASLTHMR